MPTMTGDGTGEREPLSTKQISTAQKSRMRRAASQEGSPHRVGSLFLLPKHALSAPIQSVSFWSHAGLRLFNREDTVTTVKTAAVAIRIGQKTPVRLHADMAAAQTSTAVIAGGGAQRRYQGRRLEIQRTSADESQ